MTYKLQPTHILKVARLRCETFYGSWCIQYKPLCHAVQLKFCHTTTSEPESWSWNAGALAANVGEAATLLDLTAVSSSTSESWCSTSAATPSVTHSHITTTAQSHWHHYYRHWQRQPLSPASNHQSLTVTLLLLHSLTDTTTTSIKPTTNSSVIHSYTISHRVSLLYQLKTSVYTNNNNKHTCIAPKGRNFRGLLSNMH